MGLGLGLLKEHYVSNPKLTSHSYINTPQQSVVARTPGGYRDN